MAAAAEPVRLDLVVRWRDRLFVALAPALATALMVAMLWPLVLVVCWGWFDAPWLSLPVGLLGTALLVWWGARMGKGSLAMARSRTPHLVVTAHELQVWRSGPMAIRIPLTSIRVAAVDQPRASQRRADRVRFPVGTGDSGPIGWLYCPDESLLRSLDFGLPVPPNLAVLYAPPTSPGSRPAPAHGFLAAVADPSAARAALARHVPVRPLEPADLGADRVGSGLPVQRTGRYGLREVRVEDRLRARLVDACAILATVLLLAALLSSPGSNQLPAIVTSFFLGWFLYEVPATALTGRTLGKLGLGLRVVRLDNGSARLGLGRATGRWLLRMLNGLVGSPAGLLARGDALGRIAPWLSLADGVGAGTLVVAEGEFRRLRAEPARRRDQALRRTVAAIGDLPPTASTRAAGISLLFVGLLILGVVVPVACDPVDHGETGARLGLNDSSAEHGVHLRTSNPIEFPPMVSVRVGT